MMAGGRSSRMDDSASSVVARTPFLDANSGWKNKQNMDFNGISVFNPSNHFHPNIITFFPMAKMGPLLAAQLCHQHVPPCKLLTIQEFESPPIAKKNHSKMVKNVKRETCWNLS